MQADQDKIYFHHPRGLPFPHSKSQLRNPRNSYHLIPTLISFFIPDFHVNGTNYTECTLVPGSVNMPCLRIIHAVVSVHCLLLLNSILLHECTMINLSFHLFSIVFRLCLIGIKLLRTFSQNSSFCGYYYSFLLGVYSEVELLGHRKWSGASLYSLGPVMCISSQFYFQ